MTTLTITAKGQITLKREVLEHLGLQPGSRVEVDLLPNSKVGLVGVRDPGASTWSELWASLPSYDGSPITLDQMEDAIGAYVGEDDERIMREARERRAARGSATA
jgi:bifunctional DNA-binding transcriptional regulator/antitoxin component of YhaV-PrlF toxin-antitoxin module